MHVNEPGLPRPAYNPVVEWASEKLGKNGDEIESHGHSSVYGIMHGDVGKRNCGLLIQVAQPFRQRHVDAPRKQINFCANIHCERNEQLTL